ncbi:MAG: UDP-3-O-[3-hydroxymyristoyl] N-acetylglucosamine deacetylase [Deltaproteobacteria bacterium]|nr:UDP-3-O-[3-hydroxymyristoyl] N-acetylglucosamine deacetylase [Deltaproteobacteria bacterium]
MEQVSSALRQQQMPRSSTRALVLIVDDEDSISSTLADVFRDEGYEVALAHTGPEALEMATILQPELMFLDIWMPGWDGIETMERVRAVSPLTEYVVMSGHATISNALEATRRGAFDFIEKPLDLESLLLSAARALERRQLRIEPETRETRTTNDGTSSPTAVSRLPLLRHAGAFSNRFAGENVGQRTIRRSVILYGQCLHSGQKSGLILEPLPPNSGIHFARIGDSKSVPAYVDYVESTAYATKLAHGAVSVSTIEHLLAALHTYRISNLLVKCNAEVPIFDGSSLEFCRIFEDAGIEEQPGDWHELKIDRTYRFSGNSARGEEITLEPHDGFEIEYILDYPKPIGRQTIVYRHRDVESFKSEIAPARTFGFLKDIGQLQKAGLAAGGRLDNFILIGDDGIVNTELRFPDEPVRHKVLDAIGDLFLIGRPLRGKVRAVMTGHSDNVRVLAELKKALVADES